MLTHTRAVRLAHLAGRVLRPQKHFRDGHGYGDSRLLKKHNYGSVVDVINSEHAHNAGDAVQKPHHGKFELGDRLLFWSNTRPCIVPTFAPRPDPRPNGENKKKKNDDREGYKVSYTSS